MKFYQNNPQKHILFIILSLAFLLSPDLVAQDKFLKQSLGEKVLFDITTSLDRTGQYLNAPGSFDWKQWSLVGGVITATVLSGLFLDNPIRQELRGLQTVKPTLDPFLVTGEYYGRFYIWLAASTLTYSIGLLIPNKNMRALGKNILEAVGLSTLSVVLLKFVMGRARPFENKGPGAFYGFQLQDGNMSLPSLHTASAFSFSTIVTLKLKKWWIGIPLYILSAMTFFERMYNDQHWFSDALLGAVIGTATGAFVAMISKDIFSSNPPTKYRSYVPPEIQLNQVDFLNLSIKLPH